MMRYLLFSFWFFNSLISMGQTDKKIVQTFDLQKLIEEQDASQKRYLPFINEKSIQAGIYHLKKGEVDKQQPHGEDEVYFILSGTSDFTVEEETTTVKPGDVLFVKAELDHRFSNIREDLRILVWFSGSAHTDHDFMWKQWNALDVAIPEQSEENSWNVFLEVPTMITGMYNLPEKVGGDSVLTHEVDEINYVVKGKAKFSVGNQEFTVAPGSVMFVKAGNGHRFHDLEGDLEVYIMFHQK